MPKCLERGPFWDQKWVNDGSKMCLSKSDPGPFGMLKHVCLAHFEPVFAEFSPPPPCVHQVLPFARTLEPYGGAT